MRRRLAVLAMLVTALVLPAGALAASEQEPNDGIHQAFGPLAAGTGYSAAISAHEDADWYILYVSGQGVLDLAFTATAKPNCACRLEMTLRNQDGEALNSTDAQQGEEHILYTTPGPGKYYVEFTGAAGFTYSLRAVGPLTAGPRPGPAEATTNGHSSLAKALGPLAGGKLYGASIDAYDEEDWFYFHTARAGALDVALTTTFTGTCTGCASIDMNLLTTGGERLNATSAGVNRTGHIRYTAAGPTTLVLQAEGPAGSRYQFEIAPAGLLTPTPPPRPVAAPTAKLAKSSVKRKKKLTLTFKGIASGAKVTATWKRKGVKTVTRIVTVKKGKAKVKAPNKKGRYKLTVSYLGKVLVKKTVRVK